jgi:hypothetical protein
MELQKKLALSQQVMGLSAERKFAVLYLQSIYRGYCGRLRWKKVKAGRLISLFIFFRLYFRKRTRAAKKIQHCIRKYLEFIHLHYYCVLSKYARRIQVFFRQMHLRRRAVILVTCAKMWKHVKLFALVRSKKALIPLERYRYIVYRCLRGYVQRQRLRR